MEIKTTVFEFKGNNYVLASVNVGEIEVSTSDKQVICVLDNSTSMERDIGMLKSSMYVLRDMFLDISTDESKAMKKSKKDDMLKEKIDLTVISFSDNAKVVWPSEGKYFDDAIDSMEAWGSTNIEDALDKAKKVINPRKTTWVIFMSDGDANRGNKDTNYLSTILKDSPKTIVRSIGFGTNYDPQCLSKIGKFSLAKTQFDLPAVFGAISAEILTSKYSNMVIDKEEFESTESLGSKNVSILFSGMKINTMYLVPENIEGFIHIKYEDMHTGKIHSRKSFIWKASAPIDALEIIHSCRAYNIIKEVAEDFTKRAAMLKKVMQWGKSEERTKLIAALKDGGKHSVKNYASSKSSYRTTSDHVSGYISSALKRNNDYISGGYSKDGASSNYVTGTYTGKGSKKYSQTSSDGNYVTGGLYKGISQRNFLTDRSYTKKWSDGEPVYRTFDTGLPFERNDGDDDSGYLTIPVEPKKQKKRDGIYVEGGYTYEYTRSKRGIDYVVKKKKRDDIYI